MNVLDLVRADLRDFGGYGSARKTGLKGRVWLNANESPWASPADPGQGLNRYPEPQPAALRSRLSALYGVPEDTLLMTRGSDEGIDLLTRALCRAEREAILVGQDTAADLAVLKVQGVPTPMPFARFADADDLRPGETVLWCGMNSPGVVRMMHAARKAGVLAGIDCVRLAVLAMDPGASIALKLRGNA